MYQANAKTQLDMTAQCEISLFPVLKYTASQLEKLPVWGNAKGIFAFCVEAIEGIFHFPNARGFILFLFFIFSITFQFFWKIKSYKRVIEQTQPPSHIRRKMLAWFQPKVPAHSLSGKSFRLVWKQAWKMSVINCHLLQVYQLLPVNYQSSIVTFYS